MKLEAHAKVNLFLHVVRRLPNGYHEIETIFQPLKLSDTVDVKRIKNGIRITSNANIPLDEKNSAYKAAKRLGVDGVKIHIEKNIPLAGGLGGSAVDAAPVLKVLNKTLKKRHSIKKLVQIAGGIAADTAQALHARLCVGTGIGSDLKVMPKLRKECVLLADVIGNEYYKNKPKTAYLYSMIDKDGEKNHIKHVKRFSKIIRALKKKNWKEVGINYENDFESVVFKDYPKIKELKNELKKTKPDVYGMSGAGSVVFAFYPKKDSALEAEKQVKKKFKCWTLITETL